MSKTKFINCSILKVPIFENRTYRSRFRKPRTILNISYGIITNFLLSNCFQYQKLLHIIKRQELFQKELNFYKAHINISLLC